MIDFKEISFSDIKYEIQIQFLLKMAGNQLTINIGQLQPGLASLSWSCNIAIQPRNNVDLDIKGNSSIMLQW